MIPFVFGKPYSDDWTGPLSRFAEVLPRRLSETPPEPRMIVLNDLDDIRTAEDRLGQFPNTFSTSFKMAEMLNNGSALRGFLRENNLGDFMPPAPDGFPFFFKVNGTSGGSGTFIVHDERQKASLIKQHKERGYSMQAAVMSSLEYVAHVLAVGGDCKKIITYECALPDLLYVKCGPMAGFRVNTPGMNQLSGVFLALGYTGFACVNYKLDYRGMIKIFEINPRMGSSLVFNPVDLREMMDAFGLVFAEN